MPQLILPILYVCFVAITCPAPAEGTFTDPIPDNILNGMMYLQSYTYTCLAGYITDDPLTVQCQPDGTLSITPPVCRGLLDTFALIHFTFML